MVVCARFFQTFGIAIIGFMAWQMWSDIEGHGRDIVAANLAAAQLSTRIALLEAAQAMDRQTLITGRDARIQFQNEIFQRLTKVETKLEAVQETVSAVRSILESDRRKAELDSSR